MSTTEKETSSPLEESKSDSSSSSVHVCATKNCGKPAEMACPTCLKLGLAPIRFCTQECFKASWNEHKAVHKEVKKQKEETKYLDDPLALPKEFKDFVFTGTLRPAQKSPRRTIPEGILLPDYANDPEGIPLSERQDRRENTTIKVYNEEELLGIREACRIGREVLDAGGIAVAVGVTCDEIDRVVHEATVTRGAYPSPLNYMKFPKSVCTSVNEVGREMYDIILYI